MDDGYRRYDDFSYRELVLVAQALSVSLGEKRSARAGGDEADGLERDVALLENMISGIEYAKRIKENEGW